MIFHENSRILLQPTIYPIPFSQETSSNFESWVADGVSTRFSTFFWKYPNTKFISKRLTTQDTSYTNYYICNFCIIFITQNTPSIFPDVFTSMHLHHGLCLMTCSLVGTTCHLYLNGKRKKTHRENTSSGQWRTTSHNIHVCTDTVRPLPIAAK